mmetsp:Transcript_29999/g.36561  ORF Transcript_29999/g.36561 Transcript_29999/m.36561 type:complete len:318 (-) Transcript_29999:295-1248(-)
MAAVTTSINDFQSGVTPSTLEQQSQYVLRWSEFLRSVGFEDPLLNSTFQQGRVSLIAAFASSIGRNLFGTTTQKKLLHGTVHTTVGAVCSFFREHSLTDPSKDQSGNRAITITCILKGYKDKDLENSHQKALPLLAFEQIAEDTLSPKRSLVSRLIVDAFFFTMRSCEYTKTTRQSKTKRLRARKFRFYKNNQHIQNHHDFPNADFVSITFQAQKKEMKNVTVTHEKSTNRFCPVKTWGRIINDLSKHEKANESTFVNTYFVRNKAYYIHYADITAKLKETVTASGPSLLGFTDKRVGIHSIRTSTAMAMVLARKDP